MPSAETPSRKLLIIAYNFPPQLSGVRRTVKFIKYLAPLGWDISVLTVKPVRSERFDNSPLNEIRGLFRVYRSGSLDPYRLAQIASGAKARRAAAPGNAGEGSRRSSPLGRAMMRFLRHWIFTVDDRAGWLPFALLKALRIVRHERPDWIMTTSLPNTSHLVGLALKMLHPRLKWIADFRDGWTLSRHYYAPPTPPHRWVNERLERAVARRCDLLVTVSPPLTEFFKAMPGCAAGKCHNITNGYDPEDFEPAVGTPGVGAFTLVYTGSFFGSRSPEGLLKGLAEFLARHPEARGNFRAEFFSQWDQAWLDRARELGLADIVSVRDFMPYRACIARQAAATALLLLIPARPHEPIMMTQKVFEYLASRRPILCLAPEGVAARALLGETGGAVFAHPDDPAAIAQALGELWAAWRANALERFQPRGVEQYARPALTRRLHDLMIRAERA